MKDDGVAEKGRDSVRDGYVQRTSFFEAGSICRTADAVGNLLWWDVTQGANLWQP